MHAQLLNSTSVTDIGGGLRGVEGGVVWVCYQTAKTRVRGSRVQLKGSEGKDKGSLG